MSEEINRLLLTDIQKLILEIDDDAKNLSNKIKLLPDPETVGIIPGRAISSARNGFSNWRGFVLGELKNAYNVGESECRSALKPLLTE
jgi:hypothetical protein